MMLEIQLDESKEEVMDNWWRVPKGTPLYHIVSSGFLRKILEGRRFLLSSLERWNKPDNVEANKLNRTWVRFDETTRRHVSVVLDSAIEHYYALCFTRAAETKEMWDVYGSGSGCDVGVRLEIDADKLREAVQRFWEKHRCVFSQTDNCMPHESEPYNEHQEIIEGALNKCVLLDHVDYKTNSQLSTERNDCGEPEEVALKEIEDIALDKMISKAFEDETRLIIEFGCDLIEGFLPLHFESLDIIRSYTINPAATEAQRERVEGLLYEFREISKLKKSELENGV